MSAAAGRGDDAPTAAAVCATAPDKVAAPDAPPAFADRIAGPEEEANVGVYEGGTDWSPSVAAA
eukprot:10804228-Alexandrium_andersonii.AAC.1